MSATLYLPATLVRRVNAYLSSEERPEDLTPELLKSFQWKINLCQISEECYYAFVSIVVDSLGYPFLSTTLLVADTFSDEDDDSDLVAEGDLHDTLNSDFPDFDSWSPLVRTTAIGHPDIPGPLQRDEEAMHFSIASQDESEALTAGVQLPRIEWELHGQKLAAPPCYPDLQSEDDDDRNYDDRNYDKETIDILLKEQANILTALSRATVLLGGIVNGDKGSLQAAEEACREFKSILRTNGFESEDLDEDQGEETAVPNAE